MTGTTDKKRKIAIVTSCRADWGLLQGVVKELQKRNDVETCVIATNMHLHPAFGNTIDEIIADGIEVAARVPMLDSGSGATSPTETAMASSRCLSGMAEAFNSIQPDIILLLGDRYEMLPVATAATIMGIPIAHIAGGEISEGAFDDNIRHALTKLSALHFTATEDYRQRVIQMGEEPSRVFNFGALGVENLMELPDEATVEELEKLAGLKIGTGTLLVTYHPATLDNGASPAVRCMALLKALDRFPQSPVIFTYPNNDPGGSDIIRLIEEYAAMHTNRCSVVPSLGRRRYLSALKHIGAVVGNSSSGIVEVPSAHIPTVDIGIRQRGRTAAESVIHCGDTADEISDAISLALSETWRMKALNTSNPYQKPGTAQNIACTLATFPLQELATKRFYDLPASN